MNEINRSNVNTPMVSAKDFPKSGFDLSYKTYRDFVLGRLSPVSLQYIMPADKFNGSNDSKLTFNTLVVPEISDVEVSQHNFYVPFRSIDTSFIDGMTPTELNGMSATWRTPSFTLQSIVTQLLKLSGNGDYSTTSFEIIKVFEDVLTNSIGYQTRTSWLSNLEEVWQGYMSLIVQNDYYYDNDYFTNITEKLTPFATTATQLEDLRTLIDWFFVPFIGEDSLLDNLGYNYLRKYDLYEGISALPVLPSDYDYNDVVTAIAGLFDNVPQCEYALRAYYAIWYEHYRDKYIEKRSNYLPDWRKFGSTSIIVELPDSGGTYDSEFVHFLVHRTRSWFKDMFVGSMPDDISRHVYAPIISDSSSISEISSDPKNYLNAEDFNTASGAINALTTELNYTDVDGVNRTVICPMPKAVNDALNQINQSSALALTPNHIMLRDLRKSHMLERYLKRNFYFGDEYQDRMLAHYGSIVSDKSIRRPHLLSSSITAYNPIQEVASVSTSEMQAGTRTATVTAQGQGDGFTFFAEEFGIYICILSVMPKAQYAGITPQHLLSQQTDFPLPEFANNNDEFGRVMEIATSGLRKSNLWELGMFGHYPYAHAWRSRVDEVHGSFLSEKADYTFRRFFGFDSQERVPRLNYRFLHCYPNLGAFANTVRLDGQGYMSVHNHFYVERCLPTPVEDI